jgi:hypothetical protein
VAAESLRNAAASLLEEFLNVDSET